MKIYTKTGDSGTTSLFGGKRVTKADARIDAYGTVDELNSFIGLVRDQEVNKNRTQVLIRIQNTLFVIGAILATEPGNTKVKIPSLHEDDVLFLEKEIDSMDAELPPLRFFILPGGHTAVSFCHVARTVCRRAERLTTALYDQEKSDPLVIKYLNRLSDYLFVLSRMMTKELGVEEVAWKA
ncbi:cob(I)yrinic acid a,c-diamide adenosyltransferase [Chryseolinea sp. H1M3-3]|uniref:cob(I)yrinic acid a,c-diamide adenosyltransferase n=1 Tax=Chryseolinea sp. H1M3-3 TaxID=3034144 RepID=UPI0023EE15B9|nr:cob(I)yrinic acid a,c-diamide adenosyltransferase [Chryseolinea sp. H1M3-3]